MSSLTELSPERLRRKLEREKKARENIEELLETKTREVFLAKQRVEALNEKLHDSLSGSIHVLAHVSEMFSPTLGSHARRVASLCLQISQQLELEPDLCKDVEMAGLLHDIGKLRLPRSVLGTSPDDWSDKQRELVKSHVTQGVAIISMVPNMERVCKFVEHHHEKFNGRGYPNRLQGEDIPLGARIVSIASAFDFSLHRIDRYHDVTVETALAAIQRRTPSSFDPAVVHALAEVIASGGAITGDLIDVKLTDLRPGMSLARDIVSNSQVMLLPAEAVLSEKAIERLNEYNEAEPLTCRITIYRKSEDGDELTPRAERLRTDE